MDFEASRMITCKLSVSNNHSSNSLDFIFYLVSIAQVLFDLLMIRWIIFLVPHPPKNLSIEKVTSNTVVVHWEAPTDSIFTEYSIRYRTEDDPRWVKLPSVRDTEAEVADMTPGERYTIQVNTVSYGVESLYPLQVNHTVSKYTS